MGGLDPNVDWGYIQRAMGANPATQDAAYMAFLRQMGAEEANIKNEIQARVETSQRAVNRAAAGYSQQKKEATRNTALGYEDRGFTGGGIAAKAVDEAGAKVDYDRQQYESGETDAIQEANRKAQVQLSDLARQRTEQEFAARRRIGEGRAQQVYDPTGAPRSGQ
jgi:hypothetical protein